MRLKSLAFLFALLMSIGMVCLPAVSSEEESIQAPYTMSLSYNARSYLLGPNDIISISVYDSPEFDQRGIRVQPDGNIILAPLGVINVSGMTLEKLNDLLIDKYKYYLKDPKVSINLDTPKPFIVYVAGAVLNPGSFELNTDTSKGQTVVDNRPEVILERKTPILSNILVAAGGLTYDADLEHVKIKNEMLGAEYDINLLDLILTGNSNQDIYLIPGDSVYVPRLATPLGVDETKYKQFVGATFSQKIIPVKVYGYVKAPGLVRLESSQSANLNSAIVAAGGYLQDSAYAPHKIYLSRIDNNNKLVTRIISPTAADVVLMPNDIIYVPEKPRPLVGKFFDYVARILNVTNGIANSYNNWALMFDPHRYQIQVVGR